ncbi:ATPase domain-containing protein [Thermococcus sp.]|uniref:RAD55 family ATPase n=1 Tax=Thermococcus sp. TaxID=35749 RepID=UPI00262723F3|nr:ATPase domain-containing protein [Thermococcus sp.]
MDVKKRIPTGVPGLDKMIHDGLIPGRVYLVKGGPGLGKTTLAIQFLMEGVRNGEDVLYITLEESLEMVHEDMKSFGFDLKNPKFHGIDATPVSRKTYLFEDIHYAEFAESLEKFIPAVEKRLKEYQISRVAVDPITMLRLTVNDELTYRRLFIDLIKLFADYEATVVITSDIGSSYSFGIEDYLTSGVIELRRYDVGGKALKGIRVTKFRGSPFDEDVRPYAFTDTGIEVYASERMYEKSTR